MTLKEKIAHFAARKLATLSYESEVKFITTPNHASRLVDGVPFFDRSAEKLNSPETVERFKTHYTNPNEATSIMQDIWQENSKIWRANDKRMHFETLADTKTELPDIFWWWETDGWKEYINGGNSFGLVLPPTQVADNDGKFAISIPFESVLFYENKHGMEGVSEVVEFCYLTSPKTGVYMGADTYLEFVYEHGDVLNITSLVPYWNDILPVFRISSKLAGVRMSPDTRTTAIAALYPQVEKYLYSCILSDINEAYGHANMIERVKTFESCGYTDRKTMGQCQNGYLHSENGEKLLHVRSGAEIPCPNCNSSVAVGKVINIPIRAFMHDANQPTKAINFVSPDVTALEWSTAEIEKKRKKLYASATGKGSESQLSNANFNSELSLLMAGETQHNVLMSIRATIEDNIYHSAKIVGDMYLGGNFADVFVSMGEKFALFTREQLIALKEKTDTLGITDALRIDEQLATSNSNGDKSEERRALAILRLNKLVGPELSSKLLSLYEIVERPINAIDSAVSVSDIVVLLLKFGNIDIKSLYLRKPEEMENGELENSENEKDDKNRT